MSGEFDLRPVVECATDELYVAINSEEHEENEYVAIKSTSESVIQQNEPIYNNIISCSGSSESKEKPTQRIYKRPQKDVPDKAATIEVISERLDETTTTVKRLQIICIVLGAALVIISVTIGGFIYITNDKISLSEHASENLLGLIGTLETRTGTSNVLNISLGEQLLQMEKQLAISINNSQRASDVNKNRIAGLEQADIAFNSAAQNTTSAILELKKDLANLTSQVEELENSKNAMNKNISDLKAQLGNRSSIVAFSAYIDSSTSMSASRKTIFNKLLINENQAYNNVTGVFTCPISGIYMFSFIAAVRDTRTTWAVLKVNGVDVLHSVAEGTESQQDLQGVNIAVVKLVKGDEVWISGSGTLPGDSQGVSGYRTSSFSGFLVMPISIKQSIAVRKVKI